MSNNVNGEPPQGAQSGAPSEPPPVQAARAAAAAAAQETAAQADGPALAGDEPAALEAEIAALRLQLDQAKRVVAELDNIRKRNEREKEELAKFAITKFARDTLTIGDNLQRAIAAVPAGALEGDATLASFHEGVLMTERELLKIFEKHGVKRIEPRGEPFNPHRHQAVVEIPAPDVVSGTVIEVFQPGYVIEDRVLRPAMVGVAKGGAKAAAQTATPANEDSPPAAAAGQQDPPGFGKRSVPPDGATSGT